LKFIPSIYLVLKKKFFKTVRWRKTISHTYAKRGKIAWGVFKEYEEVRLQNSVCLVSCWSKLSNAQNPAIEGGGIFLCRFGFRETLC